MEIVEKKIERILSNLVGAELSEEELEQVAGGWPYCDDTLLTVPGYKCDDY